MAQPILMPQVGQDLTTGKLIEWRVKPGDQVKKGDIVAVVESEKASFEVEAFAEGVVLELMYAEGDTATVLEPILFVGLPGEKGGGAAGEASKQAAPTAGLVPSLASIEVVANGGKANSGDNGRRRVSPLARRLAGQLSIDLGGIDGTGPSGSVVKRDVDAVVASRKAQPQSNQRTAPNNGGAPAMSAARLEDVRPPTLSAERNDREVVFDRMRLAIAQRLSVSKRTIPHFYLRAACDVSDLQARRRMANEITGVKVSVNDAVVKAVAMTLLEYPHMNAHVSDDRMIVKSAINIGVAVAVDSGLMVPVIADVDRKSTAEIATLTRDYATAARRGVTKSTAAGTFTISNLGMYGVEVSPIINPPEAAILGVGSITRELREHQGGMRFRDILGLTLSADHRAVDGAYGARFLAALVATLQEFKFDE